MIKISLCFPGLAPSVLLFQSAGLLAQDKGRSTLACAILMLPGGPAYLHCLEDPMGMHDP